MKLKRMRFKCDPSFYSGKGLAQALGIDSHVVTRWIKSGHLKAQFRGTGRGEELGGDIYLIREKTDVRRFILGHPTLTNPRSPSIEAQIKSADCHGCNREDAR
jgi:predicted site-specific integrase-resolvase